MITLNTINDWDLVDVDNISGRLNVMWLTPDNEEYQQENILI